MWKYSLNSRIKFECPICRTFNKFVKYVDNETGEYINSNYGKCDREDKCGYHLKPENNYIIGKEDCFFKTPDKNLLNSDSLNNEIYLKEYHNITNLTPYRKNILLNGLVHRFGKERVLKVFNEYKLGTFYDGSIIYPYYISNELKTGKIMSYKDNLHRDKDKPPKWLHSWKKVITPINFDKDEWTETFNPLYDWDYYDFICNPDEYSEDGQPKPKNITIPLFGWDLIEKYPDKNICLVESEKTSIICSILFPEFVWCSTGGKGYLQPYKFPFNSGKNWLLFPDLGQNNSSGLTTKDYWINQIKKVKNTYEIFDFYPEFIPPIDQNNKLLSGLTIQEFINNGNDISDFILEYPFKCGEFDNYTEYLRNVLKPYQ